MPKIDLLPCPFCGGKAEFDEVQTSLRPVEWSHKVICPECYAILSETSLFKTKEEAAMAWNTRASGWISCNVKLPEVGEPVLIYEPYNKEMVVASLDCEKMGFSNDDYWYGLKNVPFWMPLPEPPKEVEE